MDRFFAALTGKLSTRISYGNVRRNLEDYFGKDRLVRDISPADADAWRSWMVEHDEKGADGKIRTRQLATPTISRRVIAARTMWRKAIRWKLAAENPFIGTKTGHQCNEARKAFITRETIDKVINATTDTEWKVIIALARYGGLRCPSEHYALRWIDIDWDRGTIRVPCPKLEHVEQLAARTIPLFPELRGHLLKLFEEAPEGTEHVIQRNRLDCVNLRTQFLRIIRRAGVTAWPKLFHNLRASRETELMREYDLMTVCRWIGNSPSVAAKHYAMSVDLGSDFRHATGRGQAQQKAQQSAAGDDVQGMTSEGSENENAPENRGNVDECQLSATADKSEGWAVQGSNL